MQNRVTAVTLNQAKKFVTAFSFHFNRGKVELLHLV